VRHWKIISALVAILGEGALQISGFQCIPLAVGLALLAFGLLLWSAWPTISRLRFQRPITLKSLDLDKETNLSAGTLTSFPSKLQIVFNAIVEARQSVSKDRDITVYRTDSNGLISIYPEELKNILTKFQDDYGILIIKAFPEWLMPKEESSGKDLLQSLRATLDKQRDNFIVEILPKFDKYIGNEKQLK
jgi:hypothetical protein